MYRLQKVIRLQALLVWVFACLFLVGCGKKQERPVSTYEPVAPKVGAYYYFWYPKNWSLGMVRRKLQPSQRPVLGFYRSDDVSTAESHIAWCSRFGIDFLALDYWPARPDQNQRIDDTFLKAGNIQDIQFCIFYETWNLGFNRNLGTTHVTPEKMEALQKDVRAICRKYFSHPSYLSIRGRPVLILYLSRTLSGEYEGFMESLRSVCQEEGYDPFLIGDEIFWEVAGNHWWAGADPVLTARIQKDRLRLFDGLTGYNLYESFKKEHEGWAATSTYLQDTMALYQQYQQAAGPEIALMPGLTPGYNDRGCRPREDHYVIPRKMSPDSDPGSFFQESLHQASELIRDSSDPLVFITSWNEWNEDTAIEPLVRSEAHPKDTSPSGSFFTAGYPYEGFEALYLELIQKTFVSVAGRVLSTSGEPVSHVEVQVYQENSPVTSVQTDSRGYFRLPRWGLPSGAYSITVQGGDDSQEVLISEQETVLVDMVID